MDPNLLVQQRKLNSPISIGAGNSAKSTDSDDNFPVKIRYGFKNNTITKVQKSVLVTQKPFRNSVLISTSKTSTKTKKIVEKSSNETSNDNWKVYNFLKSIVKLG